MSKRSVSPEVSEENQESKRLCQDEQPKGETSKGDESITSVVEAHYNDLKEKGLDDRNKSRIVYLRNFNNWIKSMLINEYVKKFRSEKDDNSEISVLDMCCGKGGDLLKWKNNNVQHLVCADLAQLSVEECQRRFEEMKHRNSYSNNNKSYTAEFITADCTQVRLKEKFQNPDLLLDMVSCQFAFHYSFESLPQAECMIRNAAESLRPGGFFIGTIPDANDIVARLKKSDSSSFGNEVFSIKFDSEDKESFALFGAKYEFFLEGVVNCPEFLVHFPTLIKLASNFGLKLVAKERFQDYFERMKEEGRGLMGRMQTLETYPPFEKTDLLGKQEEYQHADKYLQEHTTTARVGTLTQSEWEALTLYLVFAFQKEAS
ncbi:mRNA cap guanine-N7 methyltransferase [Planococcus citri]|uniref:mRNA cap guanine-N7 methyltransferase n=1 Tax=Planococcus citri TaxID=170843 RepID=UPI0031F9B116